MLWNVFAHTSYQYIHKRGDSVIHQRPHVHVVEDQLDNELQFIGSGNEVQVPTFERC